MVFTPVVWLNTPTMTPMIRTLRVQRVAKQRARLQCSAAASRRLISIISSISPATSSAGLRTRLSSAMALA